MFFAEGHKLYLSIAQFRFLPQVSTNGVWRRSRERNDKFFPLALNRLKGIRKGDHDGRIRQSVPTRRLGPLPMPHPSAPRLAGMPAARPYRFALSTIAMA